MGLEIAAAELVEIETFNAQLQPQVTWPDVPVVAQAYLDQMVRGNGILTARASSLQSVIDRAAAGTASAAQLNAAADQLDGDVAAIEAGTAGGDADRMTKLAAVLRGIAD